MFICYDYFNSLFDSYKNFLKQFFLKYIRMKNMSNKMNIKDILSHSSKFNKLHRALKSKRKPLNKKLKNKIDRNILKRKQNKINNELKKLK